MGPMAKKLIEYAKKPETRSVTLNPDRMLQGSTKVLVGENVYVRLVRERNAERFELAVILNDETTAEQLRNSWGKIDALREKLKAIQGNKLTEPVQVIRVLKAIHLETGMSYAEVALETNHDVLVNLCAAFLNSQKKDLDSAWQYMSYAQAQLTALRMKPYEVADWTWMGLEEIEKGRAPWTLTSGPVNKERVRANYRQLDRELNSSKVVIGKRSFPKVQERKISELKTPLGKKALELANGLLAKEPDDGGLPKLNEAIARHIELQRVENTG